MEITIEDKIFIESKEIFKHLDIELYKKIPQQLRKFISEYNTSSDYIFKYDETKKLIEQNICEDTKDFISMLHYLYWCSEEERKELDLVLMENERKETEKYFSNKAFQTNKAPIENEGEKLNTELLPVKKENIIIKIFNKIKSLFIK